MRCTLELGGDCEDLSKAIVALDLAALLRARVEWLPQPEENQDHVSARVLLAGVWEWQEASLAGARLGENPYQAAQRLAVAVPS